MMSKMLINNIARNWSAMFRKTRPSRSAVTKRLHFAASIASKFSDLHSLGMLPIVLYVGLRVLLVPARNLPLGTVLVRCGAAAGTLTCVCGQPSAIPAMFVASDGRPASLSLCRTGNFDFNQSRKQQAMS